MIIRERKQPSGGGGLLVGSIRSITCFMLLGNILFASYLLHKQSQICNTKQKRAVNPTIKHPSESDPYELARSQSFGFFYDIPSENWRLSQQLYSEHDNHRFPEFPLTYNPRAEQHQSDPRMWRSRNNHKGFSLYDAWYQNVSFCFSLQKKQIHTVIPVSILYLNYMIPLIIYVCFPEL